MVQAILVIGATGKQGGSTIRALIAHPSFSASQYSIYALTRDPTSASARALSAKSSAITLVQGDLSDAAAIFRSLPSAPWGVYAMTNPGKQEVAWGKALIDESIKAGVSHIVFSSVDRGSANGGNTPSSVPHWVTKHEIEGHLRRAVESTKTDITYTILRPVFFLDNLAPGFLGKVTASMWKDFLVTKPLKVIDTNDIGLFAAAAFLEPESPAYKNTALNLAGDELTFAEANEIFKARKGYGIPVTYKWITGLLLFLAKDLKLMTQFLQGTGYGADLGVAKSHIEMTDFAGWVPHSKFPGQTA